MGTEHRTVRFRNGWLTITGAFNMLALDAVERTLVCAISDAFHRYETERTVMTLKAGTIVHVCGFPVEIVADTEVMTAPANAQLIADALAEQLATGRDPRPASGEAQSVGARTD